MGVFNEKYKVKFKILEPSNLWHFKKRKFKDFIHTQKFRNLERNLIEQGTLDPIMAAIGNKEIYDIAKKEPKIIGWNGINRPNIISFPDDYKEYFYIPETSFGGARLFFAEKHDFLVRCLISDFEDLLEEPEITEVKEIISSFHNLDIKEEDLIFSDNGLTHKDLLSKNNYTKEYYKFVKNFDDI